MNHEDWDELADALRARAPRDASDLPEAVDRAARVLKVGEDVWPRGSLPWLAEVARLAFDLGAVPEAQTALLAAEARVDAVLAKLADLRDALAEAREAMQDGDEAQFEDALAVVTGTLGELKQSDVGEVR
ncbi:hypothetical protein JYK14_07780 [Siccirubricoccus sp. KC 17139]|uniref:Uncharacterized protein n=1 Tax=Siccirubricoccus soli TaxID=2899147 RepID=A0ABT1D4D2_9PROT|nr:hypothetical protein [Siccirubricoccus soli]MCO6416069.1 hypothetical protein [Siccirubricoccus soli]MCP2682201.1 hypothetical protein [Siccirubricoccus soli]